MRLWVVGAALLFALSGCSGSESGDGSSGGTQVATVKDVLPAAQAAGKAWNPEAQLFSVVTFEIKDPKKLGGSAPGMSPAASDAFGADPLPGDGKAPAWGFYYGIEAEGERHLVVIGAIGDLKVQESVSNQAAPDGVIPLQPADWTLDSTEIATSAITADSKISALRNGDDALWVYELDGPGVWFVGATKVTDSASGAVVRLDANTGKVSTETLIPVVKAEHGTFDGSSVSFFQAGGNSGSAYSFELVSEKHQTLIVYVRDMQASPSTQSISFSLDLPGDGGQGGGGGGGGGCGGGDGFFFFGDDGMSVGGPAAPPFFQGATSDTCSFQLPVIGEYSLYAGSAAGGAAYQFQYCTDGEDPDPDNEACKLIASIVTA